MKGNHSLLSLGETATCELPVGDVGEQNIDIFKITLLHLHHIVGRHDTVDDDIPSFGRGLDYNILVRSPARHG